jgi:hypothetical protein
VFSTAFAPLIDDMDGDGLVELALVGEGMSVFIWDFEASSDNGRNAGRLYYDNLNSGVAPPGQVVTDADESTPAGLPRAFRLHQNYPNPFNPRTAISFEIGRRQPVKLEVFNVLGQRVATPVDQELPPGSHTVEFSAEDLASGVYLYRLTAGDNQSTRKMVLLK